MRSLKVLIIYFICVLEKCNALSMVVMDIIEYEKIEKFIYSRRHDLNEECEIDECIASFRMGIFKY